MAEREDHNDITMVKNKPAKPKKPTKERWLLTRKTWKYMTDAGRRLIPEGALNRPEDIPKIEAYFQEVCKKEPKFLLWRKSSYPGATNIRSYKRRRDRLKGGSVRQTSSADEAEELTPPVRPASLFITHTSGGRFDINKLKKDFLSTPPQKAPRTVLKSPKTETTIPVDKDEAELINMLQTYLKVQDKTLSSSGTPGFDYQDLIDKLQQHLSLVFGKQQEINRKMINDPTATAVSDPVQRSTLETLSRYYSRSPNRDHIIQDLLTDRKLLKKLYYDLRQTKGFRATRTGLSTSTSTQSFQQWRSTLRPVRREDEYEDEEDDDYAEGSWERPRRNKNDEPPPLVEIFGESGENYAEFGIQTEPLDVETLQILKHEYAEKKRQKAAEDEESVKESVKPDDKRGLRRRSSVDHDDVSQSVSDTIKRYLRMARKKSVDADKADRFKRINYDKNLRNIKPKGEISMPGDDDGLNKGSQTVEDWLETIEIVSPSAERQHWSLLSHLFGSGPSPSVSMSSVGGTCSSTGAAGGTMQKSRSSSSVVQHVSRKIWRTRSKSRGPSYHSNWTPQGSCCWVDGNNQQVIVNGGSLVTLCEPERKALQQAALARLQHLNLGVQLQIPQDSSSSSSHKPKRRAYLLKRKALTTGFLTKDTDKDKGSNGGLVFGVPLGQCVTQGTALSRRGSRTSCSSLIDKEDESGSCESLASRDRLAGSESDVETWEEGHNTGIHSIRSRSPQIPTIVTSCIQHLKSFGLHTLGIFRVSTSKKRVRQLREDWDSGKELPIESDTCPHDVATLLKEFLRDLPNPLLCRELYQAFIQTQKIRNRRLQQEALQLLVMLLPSAHQDTLHALLDFLGEVADNSEDKTDPSGEFIQGNKMDINNLATIFAPNILHCMKPGSATKDLSNTDRGEDRIDVINVIRHLLEHRDTVFNVLSELKHEAYLHLATTQPHILDSLLDKILAQTQRTNQFIGVSAEISGGFDSDSQGSPPVLRKTWSREQCLHQTAAMGGPNVAMTLRQKERSGRESRSSSKKRWRDENREDNSSSSSLSSAMTIITRLRKNQDESSSNYVQSMKFPSSSKPRSDSLDSSDINDGSMGHQSISNDSVITASLRLPLSLARDDPDIPFIEEAGIISQPVIPPRRRQRSISGSDSSVASQAITGTLSLSHVPAGYDSAVGSSATLSSPPRNLTPSSSSAGDFGLFSSPPSWASTPPMSPTSPTDPIHGDYEQFHAKISVPVKTTHKTNYKDIPLLQKVTIISTNNDKEERKLDSYKREIAYQMQPNISSQKPKTKVIELPKSHSVTAVMPSNRKIDVPSSLGHMSKIQETKYTPSISNIGGAVLRSKTADFERLLNISKVETASHISKLESAQTVVDDKKKYTKRRYTDSRHQTKHIPDASTLDNPSSNTLEPAKTPVVYKRKELISSVQTKNK